MRHGHAAALCSEARTGRRCDDNRQRDERGIKVSDGVRSAPASLTGDNLTEYYLGFNYYFFSDDVKLQFGYVNGKAERGAKEETAQGIRSQLQVQF